MDTISEDDVDVGMHIESCAPDQAETIREAPEEVEFDFTDEPDDDLLRIRESVLDNMAQENGVTTLPVCASDSQAGYLELALKDGLVLTLYPDHTWDVT